MQGRSEATVPDLGAATHLTVITATTPSSALAEALDLDIDSVIDVAALRAACERMGESRADGYAIICQNIGGEIAIVQEARARIDARIDELSRRAEELESAIQSIDRGGNAGQIGIDLADVRDAVVGYDAARRDPDGPNPDAAALADEFDAAAALRDHARRITESPMLAAAEAELDEARAELAALRERIGEIDPGLVAAVHAAHAVVEAREVEAGRAKRSARAAARTLLAEALEREQAALRACGFSTYPTFVVQIAQGGTRPEDDAELATAQRRVSEAEAMRRRSEALATVPDSDELDDDDHDRRLRAAVLLGHEPGDDPAAQLRALREPGARVVAALDELCGALAAVGIDPATDPRATAQAVLDAPPTEAVSSDIDALDRELDLVDGEGARLSDEFDRLSRRLDELSLQRAALVDPPVIAPDTIDGDDAETLVVDLFDRCDGLLVVNEAFDALTDDALERVLSVCASTTAEVVIVSRTPVVAMWARSIGAEVLDQLPTLLAQEDLDGPDEKNQTQHDDATDARQEDVGPLLAALGSMAEEGSVAPVSEVAEVAAVESAVEAIPVDDEATVFADLVDDSPAAPVGVDAPRSGDDLLPRSAIPPTPPMPPTLPTPPAPPTPSAPQTPARPDRSAARESVVAISAAAEQIDARRRSRAERADRRARRRHEREVRLTRKIAERLEGYAGANYHQPSEVAPWAHWEQAAAERKDVRTRSEGVPRANAHATADLVEQRLGTSVEAGADLYACHFHRNTETRVRCTRCFEAFCDQCLVTVGPKRELICVECAVKAAGVRARRRRA